MQSSCEQSSPAGSCEDEGSVGFEAGRVAPWMRRLWPVYCLVVAVATLGYARWDPYQIDGDAVSYMDIADLIRTHAWAGVVNGYWHPLYPALLAVGHGVFRATRFDELQAYYFVNFAVFLLQLVAVVWFVDALVRLRGSGYLLERWALRYLGVGLLVVALQRELSLGKVRPDGLLQALLLMGVAALLMHLATGRLGYAVGMGLAFGLAYLTKSFALVFAGLAIAVMVLLRFVLQRVAVGRALSAGLVGVVCFAGVAGPYVAALSRQRGRLDLGDSGSLNYAWYVAGLGKMHLQNDQPERFGSASGHLKHPNAVLLREPLVVSYKAVTFGTYPDWFDPAYWNDGIQTRFDARGEVRQVARNAVLAVRYLLNHPEGWLLFGVIVAVGGRLSFGWRIGAGEAFWMVPVGLGVALFVIYGLVNLEERYVTVGYLLILIPLFACLREGGVFARETAPALVVLLAMLAVGGSVRTVLELRRQLSPGRAGWYQTDVFRAAAALHAMGVEPGDTVACIGTRACLYDFYWARLAGVRVLTDIYVPETALYPALAAMENREQAYAVVRGQGAKVLVGYFDEPGRMNGATGVSAGWRELDGTPYYAYPLNLVSATAVPGGAR
jgi:hypothetical protein